MQVYAGQLDLSTQCSNLLKTRKPEIQLAVDNKSNLEKGSAPAQTSLDAIEEGILSV